MEIDTDHWGEVFAFLSIYAPFVKLDIHYILVSELRPIVEKLAMLRGIPFRKFERKRVPRRLRRQKYLLMDEFDRNARRNSNAFEAANRKMEWVQFAMDVVDWSQPLKEVSKFMDVVETLQDVTQTLQMIYDRYQSKMEKRLQWYSEQTSHAPHWWERWFLKEPN